MKRCAACRSHIVFGAHERAGETFCSATCAVARHPPQFCPQCIAETTDEGPGELGTFLGIGWTMRNGRFPPCPICGSRVARTWHEFLTIPIMPMEWYRVLWLAEGRVKGRLLRVQAKPVPAPPPKQPWLKPPPA